MKDNIDNNKKKYYQVKGTGSQGTFDWIVRSDCVETAEMMIKQDLMPDDIITDINEIDVEQAKRIQVQDLMFNIKQQYMLKRLNINTVTIREYAKVEKEYDNSPDKQYDAIIEATRALRAFMILKRLVKIDDLSYKTIYHTVLRLSAAEDEQSFNDIINELKQDA